MTSTQIQEMLDRSFAIDPKVDEALSALMTEARLAERWAGLSPPSLAGHHRILISFLVCAIAALGVAALAGRSTHVRCLCPVCQSPTNVDIAADGLTIESTSSPDARVWTGVTEVGACAADTQCKSMLLFCSHAHLDAWRRNQSADMRGFDLSLEQGIQLGAAIFRPFLERATKEANL